MFPQAKSLELKAYYVQYEKSTHKQERTRKRNTHIIHNLRRDGVKCSGAAVDPLACRKTVFWGGGTEFSIRVPKNSPTRPQTSTYTQQQTVTVNKMSLLRAIQGALDLGKSTIILYFLSRQNYNNSIKQFFLSSSSSFSLLLKHQVYCVKTLRWKRAVRRKK